MRAGKGHYLEISVLSDLMKSLLQPGDLKSRRQKNLTRHLAVSSAMVCNHSSRSGETTASWALAES